MLEILVAGVVLLIIGVILQWRFSKKPPSQQRPPIHRMRGRTYFNRPNIRALLMAIGLVLIVYYFIKLIFNL